MVRVVEGAGRHVVSRDRAVDGAGAVAVGEGLSDKECLFAYKMSRTRPEVKLQHGNKQKNNKKKTPVIL